MGKVARKGTSKLGWCLTGHHKDCFVTVGDRYVCGCDCHTDNINDKELDNV